MDKYEILDRDFNFVAMSQGSEFNMEPVEDKPAQNLCQRLKMGHFIFPNESRFKNS